MKRGFDYKRYIDFQSRELFKRLDKFDRLYLEFGGKLISDGHASRVLPGYKKTTKIDLLKRLGKFEVVYCVNAKNLESGEILEDFGLDYYAQSIKDIRAIEKAGFKVSYVLITMYEGEKRADKLKKEIGTRKRRVLFHYRIPDYPNNLGKVLKGYGKQPFLNLKEKLIIVTGTAGGSGKMATCLSQIYSEIRKGKNTGFAKFETFPIWNLSLSHPVNSAYEAATANLGDVVKIDPYHRKAYKKRVVNYNRDIENFTILKRIVSKMTKKRNPFGYRSPTDMGVNMAFYGIVDDKVCRNAAIREIKNRWRVYNREFKKGREKESTIKRMKKILKKIQ